MPEMIEIATAESWNREPLPEAREQFKYTRTFSEAEAERIKYGIVPEMMEDKWFVLFEDEWLLFCRSWTGFCIYGLRLAPHRRGARVAEAWVNRDPEQYRGTDLRWDRDILDGILDWMVSDERGSEDPVGEE